MPVGAEFQGRPAPLGRPWERVKVVTCIASRSDAARKAGMTEAMFGELMATAGMANETNRLVNGCSVAANQTSEI